MDKYNYSEYWGNGTVFYGYGCGMSWGDGCGHGLYMDNHLFKTYELEEFTEKNYGRGNGFENSQRPPRLARGLVFKRY